MSHVRDQVLTNTDDIVKKAKLFACTMERAAVRRPLLGTAVPSLTFVRQTSSGQPMLLCQTVTELLNQATSPARLYAMDALWFPWL